MSAPVRILAFVAALVAVFGLALLAGRGIGPIGDGSDDDTAHHEPAVRSSEPTGKADAVPGGLMVSSNGYTFVLDQVAATPGAAVPVSFRIKGPDEKSVTTYDMEHEKQLHLIAVRRDLSGFQHVHPVLADGGTWSTDLALTSGDWRLFADFKPTGADPMTLGADLQVAGTYQPVADIGETRTSTVDGYEVRIDGELVAGADARLTLTVTKAGRPVTDLQPYLGAYGHLVALREGDLAYLHVHPDGSPDDGTTKPGPGVVFYADVPSIGDYRLFLDFRHGDVVRTASFALTADAGAGDGDDGDDDEPAASHPESGPSGH